MPVPVINYSAQQPQGDQSDFLGSLLRGFNAGFTPFSKMEELKSQKFGNQLAELKNKFAPQQMENEIQQGNLANQLSQLQLQYQPRIYEQNLQSGSLADQLTRLRMQALQKEMNAPPGFTTDMGKKLSEFEMVKRQFGEDSPQAKMFGQYLNQSLGGSAKFQSPFAKAQQDRDQLVAMYGEGSDKVNQFDQYLSGSFKLDGGSANQPQVVLDPNTGKPLINISGMKGAGSRMGGGTYLNPETSEIIGFQTPAAKSRDLKTISGAENVKAYVNSIKELAPAIPLMTSAWGKGRLKSAALSNAILGTDFSAPSDIAELDASIKSFAEGFINQFGLNATNENVNKAESIISPKFGENTDRYLKRVEKQLKEFGEIQQRAQSRLAGGQSLGYLGGEQNRGRPVDENAFQALMNNSNALSTFNQLRNSQNQSSNPGVVNSQNRPSSSGSVKYDPNTGGFR